MRALACLEKRKLLDDLEQEKNSLETDLENHEARLVELHKDHVDRAQVTCQGKKKQKLDLAQNLERKLHAIQRMQVRACRSTHNCRCN